MGKNKRRFKKQKDRERQSRRKVQAKRILLREEQSVARELDRVKWENRERLEPIRNENLAEVTEDGEGDVSG